MSGNEKITVENMNLTLRKIPCTEKYKHGNSGERDHSFIRTSGCGKSTLLKSLNRMNDLVEGCAITGKVQLDGEDIYGDMDVNLLKKEWEWYSRSPILSL